jgi:FAD:protein FMN transferase
LLDRGATSVLVDLGGDIRVAGTRPNSEPWVIGIRHPERQGEPVALVRLAQGGLATSGDYERFFYIGGKRYSHLLDPRTGWPLNGFSSVTVTSNCCLEAGKQTTIALLQGENCVSWLENESANYLAIDETGATIGPLLSNSQIL